MMDGLSSHLGSHNLTVMVLGSCVKKYVALTLVEEGVENCEQED